MQLRSARVVRLRIAVIKTGARTAKLRTPICLTASVPVFQSGITVLRTDSKLKRYDDGVIRLYRALVLVEGSRV